VAVKDTWVFAQTSLSDAITVTETGKGVMTVIFSTLETAAVFQSLLQETLARRRNQVVWIRLPGA
jgi:hypothetical protein